MIATGTYRVDPSRRMLFYLLVSKIRFRPKTPEHRVDIRKVRRQTGMWPSLETTGTLAVEL